MGRAIELSEAMSFLKNDDVRTKVRVSSGEMMDFLPSRDFYIKVDKQKVLDTGTVQPEDAALITDSIKFSIKKRYLSKSEIAVLNMVAANNWERPIYIDHSLVYTGNIFFTDWLQFEGLAYRLVPIKKNENNLYQGHINTDILFENVMNKFVWGNVNDPDIFLDDYNKLELRIIQARHMFSRLAEALNNEGKHEKAVEVIDKMFELFPNERIPLSYDSFPAIEQYFKAGENEKGTAVARILADNSFELLEYYIALPGHFARAVQDEQNREISLLKNILVLSQRYNQTDLNKEVDSRLQKLIERLSSELGS